MTERELIGIAALVVLFALLILRVPVGIAMIAVGIGGNYALSLAVPFLRFEPYLKQFKTLLWGTVANYDLSVVPLFILMGFLASHSKLSRDLFQGLNALVGRLRGGVAMAAIGACAGFGAVCGSSLATASTMGRVALPELDRLNYAPRLATGTLAAGGTLGILIPPSVAFVFYGIMTQTDIGKLFAAGILPGIVGTLFYVGAVIATTRLNPTAGPPGPRLPWIQRVYALKGVWGMLLLFALVMGGLYAGLFTPVEASGIGAGGAFLIALARRTLTWRLLVRVLVESGRTSAMLFIILIGSLLFANFINVARFPNVIADWIKGAGLGPYAVMALIVVIYVVLGCILESISMLLLTVPVFYPIVVGLDFGLGSPERTLIWFGVIVVVVIEISLITPPIGLNVFVLKSLLPETPLSTIFRGVTPFIIADCFRVALLVAVPAIALLLPDLMTTKR